LRFRTADYNRRVSREAFRYYRCSACGFLFLQNIPSDLGRYYQSEYYLFPKSIGELAQQAESWESYKLELLRKHVSAGNVLDIGAGAGRFVYLATRAGYQADAVEMDSACRELITSCIPGSRAFEKLESVQFRLKETYDAVTMWHVLEHMENPWAMVEMAVQYLKPGGLLVIAMPNPESVQFRVFGKYWAHLDAPRHLQLVPQALLISQLTKRAALGFLEITTTDAGTLYYNGMGWIWSANNFVKGGWRIGAVLSRVFRQFDRVGLRGSCYTALFRKP
jgi:2-polyprenyl-3-methyl-5-hydroxy-6-metoxy-1,4-benzoquinol methylase